MSSKRHHADWLSLVEVSGPFVSTPVLEKAFPQGLDAHDSDHARNLRQAYDEWQDDQESRHPTTAIHHAWIKFVLTQTLGFLDEVLAEGQAIPAGIKATIAEHGETLRPDLVLHNTSDDEQPNKPRLLVQTYPADQRLEKPIPGRHWKASPATRMMELLHVTDVRLGLVTNGEQWMLVDAPRGEATGFASWYAWLWFEQSDKGYSYFRSFRSLLCAHRFFSVADAETLEAILAESATHQQEVTDQLGLQVRRAVEVLIQSLDRADQDDKVLAGVPETVLYEAALTVMMRLVFLFSAEERGLLLLGDPLYDEHYAVSTLVAQLEEAAEQHGEEVLERRPDAWVRMLSTFRAVYGGVQHERMKLPAYAGNLFDPDRFPFLEGRKAGTTWRDTAADPLPVNNRTMLHVLRSLQFLELHGEARRLSFRALDIEQIGHVYEGLLDHTARRATEPYLGLVGAKGREPEVPLVELEKHRAKGEDELVVFLREETGRSENTIRRALAADGDKDDAARLLTACGHDDALFKRALLFGNLVCNDSFGRPVVIRKGSVFVTTGTDRRSSGTHYTPRILTEPIVLHALEPLVYIGPAEGKPKEEWELRPAKELLELKVCDMACGSGAFLVQACRYLSELLVEAWERAEAEHPGVPGITPEGLASSGSPGETLIPKEADERMIYARRLVAQRCLYGVDKNPLAAEMAKLSLWLLTLAKAKPFTFLDHAIRSGDSLVGISSTQQLVRFSLSGDGLDMPILQEQIKRRLEATLQLRRQIAQRPDASAQDFDQKSLMLKNAEEQSRRLIYGANLLLAASWLPMNDDDRQLALKKALSEVEYKFKDLPVEQLDREGAERLQEVGCPIPFHWPLEFPEVFVDHGGFDAIVGNPPFMGGPKITGNVGKCYRELLVTDIAQQQRGSADLCTYFLLQGCRLSRPSGFQGFVTTNTISEGDTREVGLDQLASLHRQVMRANKSTRWPGSASLEVAHVWIAPADWRGVFILDGRQSDAITPYLGDSAHLAGQPHRLKANLGYSFKGTDVLGIGFAIDHMEAQELVSANPHNREVLFPFFSGDDINSRPDQSPSRQIIYFRDWPLSKASVPSDYTGQVAEDFPEALHIVQERVKPERQKRKPNGDFALRRPLPQKWWVFNCPRFELYEAVADLNVVLVGVAHTKYWCVTACSPGNLYSHAIVVFALDGFGPFALLNSSIHEAWARQYSGSLETRLRYSPSDCFDTFPLIDTSLLVDVGVACHDIRHRVMAAHGVGLTDTYNLYHDVAVTSADVDALRECHVTLDRSVANAYGWIDLDLGHGFHETKQGVRFTISEAARREVLARLLRLNHERYAEEVRQGLHDKKKAKARKAATTTRKKAARKPAVAGRGLFDIPVVDPAFPSTARDRLLCAVVLDSVRSVPGLPSTDYLDELHLAVHPADCQTLLIGSDRAAFQRAVKKVPAELTADDGPAIPWRDVKQVLLTSGAVREKVKGGVTYMVTGDQLAVVRATHPSIDGNFVQLVGKAGERLREIMATVAPSDQNAVQVANRVRASREAVTVS